VSGVVRIASGAEARAANGGAPLAAILLNGGTGRAVPGTWSPTSELLANELAALHPGVELLEVRYRLKSWHALDSCVQDAVAAVEHAVDAGARRCLLVGFSMGGAVSILAAGHEAVAGVLGLAPWIPQRLDLGGLRGKRLDVVHGAWDRWLPGVPGVSPASSRAGFERARALGVPGSYEVIPRALHGCAVRAPSGGLVRLPRWRAWVERVGAALERFASQ
jgi:dienelactone hydrolase